MWLDANQLMLQERMYKPIEKEINLLLSFNSCVCLSDLDIAIPERL